MAADLIFGRHAVEEALSAGVPVRCILVSASALHNKRLSGLLSRAEASAIKLKETDAAFFDGAASQGGHQGIAAEIQPFDYVGVSALVDKAKGKENALIVACDHIVDPGNLGAILRSCEVVGGIGVLLPNKRQVRVTPAVYKASAGAAVHLPIALEANLASTLSRLKDEGFWVVGASEHAEDVAWEVPMSGRIVLVVGSEEKGMSRLVRETCDMLVRLPQAGKVESLNVAQAATALSYEWLRQCSASAS